MKHKNPLLLAGALSALSLLLASCLPPSTPNNSVNLTFTLPEAAIGQKLKLVALYPELQADGTVTMQVFQQTYSYASSYDADGTLKTNTLNLYLDRYALKTLASNTRCVTPFKTREAKNMNNVTISVDGVKTCALYFLAYQDANNDNIPTRAEERYNTHDIYSYASEAFQYSMTTPDGNSTESGSRTKGWSLVHHNVLQPSSTPGKYLMSMNSVPTADQGIAIRVHEPTNFMTSMNFGGQP